MQAANIREREEFFIELFSKDQAELDQQSASNSGAKKVTKKKVKKAVTATGKGPSRKSRRLADKPGPSVQYTEDSDGDGEASSGRSRRDGRGGAQGGAR